MRVVRDTEESRLHLDCSGVGEDEAGASLQHEEVEIALAIEHAEMRMNGARFDHVSGPGVDRVDEGNHLGYLAQGAQQRFQQLGVVNVRRSVERHEAVAPGLKAEVGRALLGRFTVLQQGSTMTLPTRWIFSSGYPSWRRLSWASANGAKRVSDTRSVTTRFNSSGMVQSRLRRPASTCATFTPSLAATRA